MQRLQDTVARLGLRRLARWIFRQRVLYHVRRGNVERVEVENVNTGERRRVMGRG